MRDDSDESLMLRYQKGEVRAFEVLVQRHRRPIFNFALRYTRDRAAAEDVAQDCFLRVVRGADSFLPNSNFKAWMYAIARNLCIDLSRRNKLRKASSLDAPIGDDNKTTRLERVVSTGPATDGHAQEMQLAVRVQEALSELPEEQREVFLLREVGDLDFAQIAEVVGVPEGTVKSRLRYALEKLRGALREYREPAEVAK